MNESSVRTEHLPGGPDLERILREHAYRGAYLQLTVRGALVLFIALTLIFVPPMNDAGWCFAILGAYALWSAAVALWIRKGGTGPVTIKFEYQQAKSGLSKRVQEQVVDDIHRSNVSKFQVVGQEYQKSGRVIAWRISILRGKEELVSQQSALWN